MFQSIETVIDVLIERSTSGHEWAGALRFNDIDM
jgi:hypothetical protein